jgi:hypothetical protein
MNGWVSIYQLSSVLKTCRWSLHSAPNGSFVSVRSFAMSSTFLEVIVLVSLPHSWGLHWWTGIACTAFRQNTVDPLITFGGS